jgi:hypothetical protein
MARCTLVIVRLVSHQTGGSIDRQVMRNRCRHVALRPALNLPSRAERNDLERPVVRIHRVSGSSRETRILGNFIDLPSDSLRELTDNPTYRAAPRRGVTTFPTSRFRSDQPTGCKTHAYFLKSNRRRRSAEFVLVHCHDVAANSLVVACFMGDSFGWPVRWFKNHLPNALQPRTTSDTGPSSRRRNSLWAQGRTVSYRRQWSSPKHTSR